MKEIKSKDSSEKRIKIIATLIILLSIVVSSVSSYVTSVDNTMAISGELGRLAGTSIWIGILSFLISRIVLRGRKGMTLFIFSIGILIFSGYRSISMVKENRASKAAARALVGTIDKFKEGRKINSNNDEYKDSGKYSVLVNLIQEEVKTFQNDQIEYAKKVSDYDIAGILQPDRFKSKISLIETQQKVIQITELLKQYERLYHRRVNELESKIKSSDFTGLNKISFMQNYNTGRTKSNKMMAELFNVQRSFLAEIDKLMKFMLIKQGKYEIKNSMIYFDYDPDVVTFNNYLERIQKLALEESNLLNQYYQRLSNYQSELELILDN